MPRRLIYLFIAIYVASGNGQAAEASAQTHFKFDFGTGKPASGCTKVTPEMVYTAERGFGFEPDYPVMAVDRGGDFSKSDFITAEKPFYFSVKVPEGNYRVTVTLGDPKGESTTTIKAELRRLMLESIHTGSGRIETKSFLVNVRTPRISAVGNVHLKEREKTAEAWEWDDKLTLEFNDRRPCVGGLEISRVDDATTVYLLGDSTVCDQPNEPYNSWGQMLPRFFKSNVVVANYAESGETLRSSRGAKRLDKVLSVIKPGDFVLIQFGHNDMKEKGEGVGAFTTYKAELKRYVAEARQHGGIPVVVTSMNRRTFDSGGKITNSLGDYPEAVRQVAREDNVPLIDLNAMSKPFYEALGPEKSKLAFAPGDGTHHNNYGSYELARCIVEGIKSNHLEIGKSLVDEALASFDPAHPDPLESFAIPSSSRSTTTKPLGN